MACVLERQASRTGWAAQTETVEEEEMVEEDCAAERERRREMERRENCMMVGLIDLKEVYDFGDTERVAQ